MTLHLPLHIVIIRHWQANDISLMPGNSIKSDLLLVPRVAAKIGTLYLHMANKTTAPP